MLIAKEFLFLIYKYSNLLSHFKGMRKEVFHRI